MKIINGSDGTSTYPIIIKTRILQEVKNLYYHVT